VAGRDASLRHRIDQFKHNVMEKRREEFLIRANERRFSVCVYLIIKAMCLMKVIFVFIGIPFTKWKFRGRRGKRLARFVVRTSGLIG
jgi:hypothetical protein